MVKRYYWRRRHSWRRSQTSSGFYKKYPNQMPRFIRFKRNDDGSYDIQHRRGLGRTKMFRTFAKARNKTIALEKARAYMEKN